MTALGTRKLKIEVDGVEYTAEVSKAVVTSGKSSGSFTSFAGAAAGDRKYFLNITAVQDAETGSLWREVFDNAGSDVPVVLMPYGNAAPSVTEPHYTATATIEEPEGDFLGGEADADTTARFTFEVSWPLAAKPVAVTV
jgi:hypothetical protein